MSQNFENLPQFALPSSQFSTSQGHLLTLLTTPLTTLLTSLKKIVTLRDSFLVFDTLKVHIFVFLCISVRNSLNIQCILFTKPMIKLILGLTYR